ncbi:MAG: YigZ family protein [Lachnospiraceae bacterium]|nr:YigZ family protein [Lachnospiraceae bacterium]
MSTLYKTAPPDAIWEGELIEKKSRFLAIIKHISSEDEAKELLEAERKKHYAARHHVSAYIIAGQDGKPDISHASDDGEPSGTGGRPILEILNGEGLKDIAAVVTRYFGGTLLGTGGLARAYGGAVRAALDNADYAEVKPVVSCQLIFDYAQEGKIRRILDNESLFPESSEYAERVMFNVLVPAERVEYLEKTITDSFSGQIEFETHGQKNIIVKSKA